ncbi:unnamed protein product [Nesidiocoris tenuis]|uniref:Uncharacterized protein n=1 Tax=Nesidiocoris tenuis TaxID=355587 RepID=A0A6H5G762_9HEMI|nr:unnamed protein product [Nesidiocoris tenuis]
MEESIRDFRFFPQIQSSAGIQRNWWKLQIQDSLRYAEGIDPTVECKIVLKSRKFDRDVYTIRDLIETAKTPVRYLYKKKSDPTQEFIVSNHCIQVLEYRFKGICDTKESTIYKRFQNMKEHISQNKK